MKPLSFKEFMEALQTRIDRYTHGELKEIILAQGKALPPRERAPFLDGFAPPRIEREQTVRRKKGRNGNGDLLLQEIESFGRRVDDSEYTSGWGWDGEYGDERAWGDDSWVAEIDDLFDRIRGIYKEGNYQAARSAYESLLEIYGRGSDEAQFSGYDHEGMIETDINEETLRYLRCIYLTENPSERPRAIWKALSGLSGDSRDVNIQALVNVDSEALPQFEDFGRGWLELLRNQEVDVLSAGLLIEAVSLFQGIAGLEKLATEDGRRYPSAFMAWLEALKKERRYDEMIRAASRGLESLPARLRIRARIADHLREAAVRLKKKEFIDRSLKDALAADPCLERLLDALDNAGNHDERKIILDETLALIESLRPKGPGARPWPMERPPDFQEAETSANLEIQCHLLKGDYKKAAGLLEKSKPLGWSSGAEPGALGVPFFLVANWNPGNKLAANLSALWKDATDSPLLAFYDDDDDEDDDFDEIENRPELQKSEKGNSRLRVHLERVLKIMPIRVAEKEEFFELAEKTAIKRIEAIVGNKRRKSYWKAAELLLAVAEVYWSHDRAAAGRALIDRMRNKFNRHSAFRNELRARARQAGIFTIS